MINIIILPEFIDCVKGYRLLQIEADVVNTPTSESLRSEIEAECAALSQKLEVPDINKRPSIAATRAAYKSCGKDPNRYRPSQEQLCRRVVRGLGLYEVDALVDLGNLLSLKTGCALGVFDLDKISGSNITLGVGRESEEYIGIGRGQINITGLPVLRDDQGGFGTPTSDHERTAVDATTKRVLMTIHLFEPTLDTDAIAAEARRLLETYASASNIFSRVITSD